MNMTTLGGEGGMRQAVMTYVSNLLKVLSNGLLILLKNQLNV
jgi:hypothetical protein